MPRTCFSIWVAFVSLLITEPGIVNFLPSKYRLLCMLLCWLPHRPCAALGCERVVAEASLLDGGAEARYQVRDRLPARCAHQLVLREVLGEFLHLGFIANGGDGVVVLGGHVLEARPWAVLRREVAVELA